MRRPAGRHGAQAVAQRRAIAGHDGGAAAEVAAPAGKGVRQPGERQIGPARTVEPVEEVGGAAA